MSDLRTAAQQALEALKMMRDEYEEYACPACDHADAAIYALKEALVEDAMQRFTDVNQEIEAALAEDVVTHGSAWSKDGKRIDPTSVYAEPVQEPVAWMHTDPDNSRVKFLVWRENEPAFRGVWIKTPLFTAQPQRKPLTDAVIANLWHQNGGFHHHFARAIERWLRGHA